MTEHRDTVGIYGLDEPLDVAEKLLTEQAECAVTKQRLAEARAALLNIRRMIAGHDNSPSTDYWVANALLDEIAEQCAMILEGADDNTNLS